MKYSERRIEFLKKHGIDAVINHRFARKLSFNISFYSQTDRFYKTLPKNLKYGGYRNTCYEYREFLQY